MSIAFPWSTKCFYFIFICFFHETFFSMEKRNLRGRKKRKCQLHFHGAQNVFILFLFVFSMKLFSPWRKEISEGEKRESVNCISMEHKMFLFYFYLFFP